MWRSSSSSTSKPKDSSSSIASKKSKKKHKDSKDKHKSSSLSAAPKSAPKKPEDEKMSYVLIFLRWVHFVADFDVKKKALTKCASSVMTSTSCQTTRCSRSSRSSSVATPAWRVYVEGKSRACFLFLNKRCVGFWWGRSYHWHPRHQDFARTGPICLHLCQETWCTQGISKLLFCFFMCWKMLGNF